MRDMNASRASAKATRARRGRPTRKLIELAQDKFYACETCMPSADPTYIEDLIAPARLNARELSRMVRHLRCPGCESSVTLFDCVVPYSKESLANERKSQRWHDEYGHEYESFRAFLRSFPQLGLKHVFGRRLKDAIRRAPISVLEPSLWYRVVDGNQVFDVDKFFCPSSAHACRYNREGQPAFYMADSSKTAALELLKERKMESGFAMWVATVGLRRPLRIVDLAMPFPGTGLDHPIAVHGLILSGEIRRKGATPELDYDSYRVTQFLADLIRERHLDGIRYTSCREYPYRPEVCGTCLVVLNPNFRDIADLQDIRKFKWEKSSIESPPFDWPDMSLVSIRADS